MLENIHELQYCLWSNFEIISNKVYTKAGEHAWFNIEITNENTNINVTLKSLAVIC